MQESLLRKVVLKQNKSNLAIRLCLLDDVMTTVMTSVISLDSSKKSQDIGSMALLGHEAEYHYHSLEPVVSTRSSQSAVDFLIDRYGEGKITEEYCSECGKKYQTVSSGIHIRERGCVRYYCDDQTVCDLCQYMETHPDVMEGADIYICEFLSDIKE